jgi:NAD(P)-dependent dehydrogenase (short-subunit alcohol dehydrogenase family)
VVLVTGAGRGLGRQLALSLAQHGAWVAANDITPINLDETLALVKAHGDPGQARPYLADVSSKIAVQTMLLQVLDDWGRLDAVVNNAAVHPAMPLLDMDEWDWRRVVDVNLTGAFLVTQIAGRVMREQGGGAIVNIGDGRVGLDDVALAAGYAASKAALAALTRAAARELAPFQIRVNAVCPGEVETALRLAAWLCSRAAEGVTGRVFTTGAA